MVAFSPPATSVSFFAAGDPVAKGSMIVRHIHGARIDVRRCDCRNYAVAVQDARLKEWEELVATAARRGMRNLLPFEGPVRVTHTYFFERPKAHAKLKPPPRYVVVKGRNDIEKLVRATHDAMTLAACWADDSQAMLGPCEKVYCDGFEQPGVRVEIEVLS